jgi:hypothetical protein
VKWLSTLLLIVAASGIPVDEVMSLEVEKVKSAAPFSLNTKSVTDYLIAIAAFALKPITVDSTP